MLSAMWWLLSLGLVCALWGTQKHVSVLRTGALTLLQDLGGTCLPLLVHPSEQAFCSGIVWVATGLGGGCLLWGATGGG